MSGSWGGGKLTPSAGRGELKRGISVLFCTPQAPAADRVEPGGRRTARFWRSGRNASAWPDRLPGRGSRYKDHRAGGVRIFLDAVSMAWFTLFEGMMVATGMRTIFSIV